MLPTPPGGYIEKSQADLRLNDFLNAGKYDVAHLPRRAKPADADEFTKKFLDRKELGPRHLPRIGEVMRFYDLRARAEQVAKRLDRKETKPEQFAQPMTAVAIVTDLGDDALQKKGAEYYQYLASHKLADQYFGPVIDLFFHLPANADVKWISDPIDRKMKELEPKIASDRDAAVAYYELKDFKQARMPAVEAGRKRRFDILKITDPGRRHQELARCYLELDPRPYVDMEAWAAMMLQHECNTTDPAGLANAFRHEMDLLMTNAALPAGLPPPEAEDLKKYVTRCARAVAFYLGKLDAKQAEFAAKHQNPPQLDVLYWEPEEPKEATRPAAG